VEEIGLMYTFIRTDDNARLVIPNEKLASDTIRNSTIRSAAKFAEVSVQVPPTADLRSLVEDLKAEAPGERDEVFISSLEGSPSLSLRVWTESEPAAEKLEHELRLRVHERLRERGIYA
jgi:small-conductance mechanosensitive channel